MKPLSYKVLCILACIASAGNLSAQTGDFFWSDANLGEGVVNQDLEFNVQLGESHSIFLYWSTNGPADSDLDQGGAVDITTSESGIISFDAADTLDFAIEFPGTPVNNRWTNLASSGGYAGPANEVTSDSIDRLIAFTVTGGDGIIESNTGQPFLDQGYDVDGDAFQFARVDFTALSLGTVNLLTVADESGIVSGGQTVPATILGATINVVNVPEPSTALFLMAGSIAIVARRRRN